MKKMKLAAAIFLSLPLFAGEVSNFEVDMCNFTIECPEDIVEPAAPRLKPAFALVDESDLDYYERIAVKRAMNLMSRIDANELAQIGKILSGEVKSTVATAAQSY